MSKKKRFFCRYFIFLIFFEQNKTKNTFLSRFQFEKLLYGKNIIMIESSIYELVYDFFS